MRQLSDGDVRSGGAPRRPAAAPRDDRAGFVRVDSESTTHSFVVKIWLEEEGDAAGSARWCGHITHVPSGRRRYLSALSDIAAFIVPYLDHLGIWAGQSGRWRWRPLRRRSR
jgi:hypothetical protein